MYTIKAFTQDGGEYWIHNPASSILIAGDPYYEVGDNINGQAEFDIYPDHPYYRYVEKLTTDITFYKDGEEVFNGRVLYDDEDFDGTKHVFVEGELGFLNDSIQRPAVYHDETPESLLKTVIDIHNSQVEERKQFIVGKVTVKDPNDSVYRYSNYENTREWIQDRLVDRLGGHLVIRKEKDTRYLDWLDDNDYYTLSDQKIEFGRNLLDYAKNADASNIITCLIPLGARQDEQKIEGLEDYLTIADINGGVDYVTDDNAVKEYGRIFGTNNWDDVTVASNLKTKAEDYLKTVQYENLILELTAVDLNMTDSQIDALTIRNRVRCISEPNNFDAIYPISDMKVYLMSPGKNTFTLGTETKNLSYVASNQQSTAEITQKIAEIPTKKEILDQALRDAQELINDAVASGYAIHEPNEFIVADDPDYKETARNLWRWGLGGLAHYSNGYYGEIDGVALTMDGMINGNMLMANSVYAASIDIGYTQSLETEINLAEKGANEYTDEQTMYVKEEVTNSITNLENIIDLSVVSTKEAITKKNYVTAGESETISISNWSFTGSSYASWEVAEYQNVNCIKLTFKSAGLVYFTQSLGTLPAGEFTTQMEIAWSEEGTIPSYVRYGFSNDYTQENFTGYRSTYFNTFKQKYEITESSRTLYCGIYGAKDSVVYIKNLRCLRDFEELLDDLSTSLTIEVGKVQTTVEEYYETSLYDYCLNGSFDSNEGTFTEWYRSNSSYIVGATFGGKTCCSWTSGTSYYIRQYFQNAKTGRIRIKLKLACASGYESKARLRVYVGGASQYTTAGEITTTWQEFTFDFDNVAEGQVALQLYNYVSSTTIYVTDIQILGYLSSYVGAQFTVLSDQIISEVTRAGTAEDTLTSKVTQLSTEITSEVTRATAAETKYGTCSTSASTATKVVTCSSFTSDSLKSGATICVKFTYANTASSAKLNVNSTGAKSIYANNKALSSDDYWTAGAYVLFVYDGSYWCIADSAASSKIQQLADSITLSVTSSKGTASIKLSVDGDTAGSVTAVTEARTAFANESSSVTISAGVITFNSGTIVIKGSNFSVDSSGNATFAGTLSAPGGTIGGFTIGSSSLYKSKSSLSSTTSGVYVGTDGFACGGTYSMRLSDGEMIAYHSSTETGYFDGNLYFTNNGLYGTRIGGRGCIMLHTPYLTIGGWVSNSNSSTGTSGASGTLKVYTDVTISGSGGSISWSTSWKNITFTKGLMTTSI